jgi:hypothetical protein
MTSICLSRERIFMPGQIRHLRKARSGFSGKTAWKLLYLPEWVTASEQHPGVVIRTGVVQPTSFTVSILVAPPGFGPGPPRL